MRKLSGAQAKRCEAAVGDRCRCRCGGAMHGANRHLAATGYGDVQREFFEVLPEEDPHRILSELEKKANRGRRGRQPAFPSLR